MNGYRLDYFCRIHFNGKLEVCKNMVGKGFHATKPIILSLKLQ